MFSEVNQAVEVHLHVLRAVVRKTDTLRRVIQSIGTLRGPLFVSHVSEARDSVCMLPQTL